MITTGWRDAMIKTAMARGDDKDGDSNKVGKMATAINMATAIQMVTVR